MKLIDKLELELMGQSEAVIVNGLPFIQAVRVFEQVVSSCFAVTLKEGYLQAIVAFRFRAAYMSLGITITPKV